MAVKVSVVVPVYNPGTAIEPCIDSLLAQTLPKDELELVFVNDNSPDDTPARLDALAKEQPHVRVVHREQSSGWSGTPRNDGIRVAQGEYIHFVDQDDALSPQALELLYDFASRNASDVVFGKVASDFRAVPNLVYDRRLESVTLAEAPYLVESLTPHKMFRRQFLLDKDIFFPDGKRRLEDQPFIMKCYLRAKSISVLDDHVCYFYKLRPDGKHTARQKIDPVNYFGFLREVLEIVHAETEPGEFRNQLLWRWYRVELSRWLTAPNVFKLPPEFVDATWTEVRDIFSNFYGNGEDAGYGLLFHTQGQLVRSGQRDQSEEFALRVGRLRGRAKVTELTWDSTGLSFSISASVGRDGAPLRVRMTDEHYQLPTTLTEGLSAVPEVRRKPDDISRECEAEVVCKHRESGVEWLLGSIDTVLRPVDGAPEERELVFEGAAQLNPLVLHGGRPMPHGRWDVYVRLKALGLGRKPRIDVPATQMTQLRPLQVGPEGLQVTPYVTVDGTLALAVGDDKPKSKVKLNLDETLSLATRQKGKVHVRVHLPQIEAQPGLKAAARLTAGRTNVEAPATVGEGGFVDADFVASDLGGRPWSVHVQLAEGGPWLPVGATLLVPGGGPVALFPGTATPAKGSARPAGRASRSELTMRAAQSVDAALGVLPDKVAVRVRHRLRRAASRAKLI
jgi:poly(ribitol-phosphate) beta-N-acetylglucosaminyltransferase